MAERCDCLQGFQLCHSIAGGTGGGLGALIISRLREEYPDRMTATFSVMPTHGASNTVVGPYNSLLTIHHLIESADLVHCIDNNALDALARRKLHILNGKHQMERVKPQIAENSLPNDCIESSSYMSGANGYSSKALTADTNRLVALAMSGATAAFRFPGLLNADMRKFAVNMLPFPRLHFLIPSLSPLLRSSRYTSKVSNVENLIIDLFDAGSALVACNPKIGRHLTAGIVMRGSNLSNYAVERCIFDLLESRRNSFAHWIPDGIKVALCNKGTLSGGNHWLDVDGKPGEEAKAKHIHSQRTSSFGILNSSSICQPLGQLAATFSAMFRRKAFLHWYTAEGMDPMEFAEAESDLLDLIAEYDQFSDGADDSDSSMDDNLNEQFLTLPQMSRDYTSGSLIVNHGNVSRSGSHHDGINVL